MPIRRSGGVSHLKKLLFFLLLVVGMGSASAQQGGLAELKILGRDGAPVAGVTIQLVQDGRVVYANTTLASGVVQWSSDRVPAGHYILRVTKGNFYQSMGFDVLYQRVGWSFYELPINAD